MQQRLYALLAYFTKSSLFYTGKWLLLAIAIGFPAGLASAVFLYTLDWVTNFRTTHTYLLYALPVGGLAVAALYHYWGKSVSGGNNLIIDTLHQPQQTIPFKMAPLVYVATLLTHLFGGSAGREGAAVQMAGAFADTISDRLKLSATDRQLLLTAAIAAGFGSVFGTPLAGAIFAMEVIVVGQIRYKALFICLAASYFADFTTQHLLHMHHTTYRVTHAAPNTFVYQWLYALPAGMAFGMAAWLFTKGMHTSSLLFQRGLKHPLSRPVLGGVLIIMLTLVLQSHRFLGLGIPQIEAAFLHEQPWYDFLLKLVFTIITLSSGFKGGEVTPLFYIGALLGNALASIVPLPVDVLTAMGFVAVFAGAANTPLACIVLGVELFGSALLPYFAIACVTAYYFSGHSSIYQRQRLGEAKKPHLHHLTGKPLNEIEQF